MQSDPCSTTRRPGRIHVLEVVGNAIVGGMETYVERLVENLPPERFAITALCPFESPFTDRLRARDIEVFVTPMGTTPIRDDHTPSQHADALLSNLIHQSNEATTGHAEGQPLSQPQRRAIAQFQLNLATAQMTGRSTGALATKTILGGPSNLAAQNFFVTINDVLGGDGPHPRKPDPAALTALMKAADAAPEQTLVVGDSLIDYETALRAGAGCCLVSFGFGFENLPAQLLTAELCVAHDVGSLRAVVERFGLATG